MPFFQKASFIITVNGLICYKKHIRVSCKLACWAQFDLSLNLYVAILHLILIYPHQYFNFPNPTPVFNNNAYKLALLLEIVQWCFNVSEGDCVSTRLSMYALAMLWELWVWLCFHSLFSCQILCRWVHRKPWRPSGPTFRSNMKTGSPGWVHSHELASFPPLICPYYHTVNTHSLTQQ